MLLAHLKPLFALITMVLLSAPASAQDIGFTSTSRDVAGLGSKGIVGASFKNNYLNTPVTDGRGLQANLLPTFNATDIATADINADGLADIAALSADDSNGDGQPDRGTLTLFFGTGDGTFRTPQHFTTTNLPRALAITDTDLDGALDIVIAEEGLIEIFTGFFLTTGFVAVQDRIGNPRANPAGTGLLTANNEVAALAVGRLDNDGAIDIVVIAQDGNRGMVEVFLTAPNKGKLPTNSDIKMNTAGAVGTAGRTPGQRALMLQPSNLPFSGSIDSDLDIMIATSAGIEILENNITTFAPQPPLPAGAGTINITATDTNRDGRPDLIALNHGSGTISVFLANGSGYEPPMSFAAGSNPIGIAPINFNNDGRIDMLVATAASTINGRGSLAVLTGDGRGSFQPPMVMSTAVVNPQSIVTGRFDASSQNDDVVIAEGGSSTATGGVLYLSAGQGYKPVPVQMATTISVSTDFDGQGGNNDIIVVEQNLGTIFILLNGLTQTRMMVVRDLFTNANVMPTSVTTFRDAQTGLTNIAVSVISTQTSSAGSGQIIVGFNDGTGLPRSRQFAASSRITNLMSGDFNGDGFDDLAYTDALSGIVGVALNDGKNFFPATQFTEIGVLAPAAAVLVDVNDDDFLDLAVASQGNGGQAAVSILRGQGNGRFTLSGAINQVPGFALSLIGGSAEIGSNGLRRVVDFNRDGLPDLAVASTRGLTNGATPAASVTVLLNRINSPGTFTPQQPVTLLDSSSTNGVGILQLEASQGGPGIVSGLLGDPSVKAGIGIGGANRLMAAADFNADGFTDLAVTGTRVVNGVNFRSSIYLLGSAESGALRIARPQRSAEYGGTDAAKAGFDTFVACAAVNFSATNNRPPDVVHISLTGRIWVDNNAALVLNQAPVINIRRQDLNAPMGSGRKAIITAGQSLTIPVSGFDADGDALTFRLLPPATGEPLPPFVTINNAGPTGALVTINGNRLTSVTAESAFRIGVEVSDGDANSTGGRQRLTDRTFFTLIIRPNSAPIIDAIANQRLAAGQTATVPLTVKDPEGQPVTTALRCDRGTFVRLSGSALTLTPQASDAGTTTCTVTATDQFGLAANATFSVIVINNSAPTFSPVSDITVKPGEARTITVTANDAEGNNGLRLTLISAPAFVSFIDQGNGQGQLRIAPAINDTLGGRVTIQATDAIGVSAVLTFTVIVQRSVTILAAAYTKPDLFIAGIGFVTNSVRVEVNGKEVSAAIVSVTETAIKLTGGRKRLNLKKGANEITVTVAGIRSAIFLLNL